MLFFKTDKFDLIIFLGPDNPGWKNNLTKEEKRTLRVHISSIWLKPLSFGHQKGNDLHFSFSSSWKHRSNEKISEIAKGTQKKWSSIFVFAFQSFFPDEILELYIFLCFSSITYLIKGCEQHEIFNLQGCCTFFSIRRFTHFFTAQLGYNEQLGAGQICSL